MDAKTQIIVLSFSFLFGFITYYLYVINYKIINNQKKIYRSIISIMFSYNLVLIYLIFLYKLNNGNFHIYFFFLLILGFFSAYQMSRKLLNSKKTFKFLERIKKRWYTKKNRGDIY